MLDELLKNVAVIGSVGKMGSGIAALLLQEITRKEAEKCGKTGFGEYVLTLIDSNEKGFIGLRKFLKGQLTKYAEKTINSLREYYSKNLALVSNEEIIRAFVEGGLDNIRFDTSIEKAKRARLVFEAISEDVSIKCSLFKNLKSQAEVEQYYFTNTSSIPISVLDNTATLDHKIIGFHFYNPPTVQKLIELIVPDKIAPNLQDIALNLAKSLEKVIIPSHDIAGFIGNGYFLRESIYACQIASEKSKEYSWPMFKAIYLVDHVTHYFLVRPMGIFQLMDYVGLDICLNIASIMKTYLKDLYFSNKWLEAMVSNGIKGGQNADGTQKDGCFQYDKHTIVGVYDLDSKKYVPLSSFKQDIENKLGRLPIEYSSWKKLQGDEDKNKKLQNYFRQLFKDSNTGSVLTRKFLENLEKIAKGLVETKVANKIDDVDMVLKSGFFHLYGSHQIAGYLIPLKEVQNA